MPSGVFLGKQCNTFEGVVVGVSFMPVIGIEGKTRNILINSNLILLDPDMIGYDAGMAVDRVGGMGGLG
jgi:hypothetical protein